MYRSILRNIKRSSNCIASRSIFKRGYTTDETRKEKTESGIIFELIYSSGVIGVFLGWSIYEQTIGNKTRIAIKKKSQFYRDEYDATLEFEKIFEFLIIPIFMALFWPVMIPLMVDRIRNDRQVLNGKSEDNK
jgi:hypothetical protein